MHCVLWVRWIWWDDCRCYVLCDLRQRDMMESQLVLCVVWFESGGCEGITAGDKIDVLWDLNQVGVMGSKQVQSVVWFESSGCSGVTADAMCCVIQVRWMWWDQSGCCFVCSRWCDCGAVQGDADTQLDGGHCRWSDYSGHRQVLCCLLWGSPDRSNCRGCDCSSHQAHSECGR